MTQLFEQNWEKLRHKKFTDLCLYSSHNSMSCELDSNSKIYSDSSVLMRVNEFPKFIRKLIPINKLIYSFARCQKLMLPQQLDAGVRSLDIRILETDNELYTHHSLRGPKLKIVFDLIVDFLQKHTFEFIEIKIIWSDVNSAIDLSQRVQDLVQSHPLNSLLVSREHIKFDLSENQIQNKRCFLITQGDHCNCSLPYSNFKNYYKNTNKLDVKTNDNKSQLISFQKQDDNLFDLQLILTPSNDDIKQCIKKLSFCNNNLQKIYGNECTITFEKLVESYGLDNLKKVHNLTVDFVKTGNQELAVALILM